MTATKTAKGYKGESCSEAIRSSIKPGEILTAKVLFKRAKELGKWSEDTIWQHLIAHLVNLLPARHHYSGFEPFLFLHEDGRYELYNPEIHPKPLIMEDKAPPSRREREKKPEKQLSLGLRRKLKRKLLVKEEGDSAGDNSSEGSEL
jgi:hypothetical protein